MVLDCANAARARSFSRIVKQQCTTYARCDNDALFLVSSFTASRGLPYAEYLIAQPTSEPVHHISGSHLRNSVYARMFSGRTYNDLPMALHPVKVDLSSFKKGRVPGEHRFWAKAKDRRKQTLRHVNHKILLTLPCNDNAFSRKISIFVARPCATVLIDSILDSPDNIRRQGTETASLDSGQVVGRAQVLGHGKAQAGQVALQPRQFPSHLFLPQFRWRVLGRRPPIAAVVPSPSPRQQASVLPGGISETGGHVTRALCTYWCTFW